MSRLRGITNKTSLNQKKGLRRKLSYSVAQNRLSLRYQNIMQFGVLYVSTLSQSEEYCKYLRVELSLIETYYIYLHILTSCGEGVPLLPESNHLSIKKRIKAVSK